MSLEDKSIHLLNLGCSKNLVDSENILRDFVQSGYNVSKSSEDAGVMLINTCGFIEPAKQESINEILDAVSNRKDGQKIVVAGCLSERYQNELRKEMPEVDYFYGTYKRGQIISDLGGSLEDQCNPDVSSRIFLEDQPHHAYLKIAEGCNRVCGFCAIPNIRGKQHSRPIAEIVEEAQDLQKRGIVELSLIAQDLTFYGRETSTGENLENLLRALILDTDIPWIRLMYAYPAYLDLSLLKYIANEPRLCNYLDMPIQHSSDPILKAMKRGYTSKGLNKVLSDLRNSIPGLILRTTMLVGYPTESEEDFNHLMQFVETQRFDRLGGFVYSEEEGTFAGDNLKPENIEESKVLQRLDQMMSLQQEISQDLNSNKTGKVMTVLIDGTAEEDSEYQFMGRTEGDAPEIDNSVYIKGAGAVPGTFRKVKIENAWEFDLEGTLIEEQ